MGSVPHLFGDPWDEVASWERLRIIREPKPGEVIPLHKRHLRHRHQHIHICRNTIKKHKNTWLRIFRATAAGEGIPLHKRHLCSRHPTAITSLTDTQVHYSPLQGCRYIQIIRNLSTLQYLTRMPIHTRSLPLVPKNIIKCGFMIYQHKIANSKTQCYTILNSKVITCWYLRIHSDTSNVPGPK